MRLLIFAISFPPQLGGAQTLTYQLANNFSLAGHDVRALTPQQPETDLFDSRQQFQIIRLPVPVRVRGSAREKLQREWRLLKALRTQIAAFSPDAILCADWDPCGYIAALLTSGNRKVSYFVLGLGTEIFSLPRQPIGHRLKAFLRHLAFTRAKNVFAISAFTASRLVSIGVPESQIVVIPCGIDPQDLPGKLPLRDSKLSVAPVIATICRLMPRKGCETIIQALPALTEKYPGIHFRLIGDGPSRPALVTLAENLGVQDKISFYGRVTDEVKDSLLESSDIFAMLPRETANDFEGFGIVYLEAMMHGIPVIGSRTGGIPDAIEDEVTGLLIPPDDPLALVRAIDRLLKDSSLRERLIAKAWKRINEQFRWDIIAQQYLFHIQAVLHGNHSEIP